jgi:hypothetical protein
VLRISPPQADSLHKKRRLLTIFNWPHPTPSGRESPEEGAIEHWFKCRARASAWRHLDLYCCKSPDWRVISEIKLTGSHEQKIQDPRSLEGASLEGAFIARLLTCEASDCSRACLSKVGQSPDYNVRTQTEEIVSGDYFIQ